MNILSLEEGEKIASVLPVQSFEDNQDASIMFATNLGYVKKTELAQYARPRTGSIWAIKLEDGDSLVGVRLVNAGDSVILGTRSGLAIQFDEADVRSMGRFVRGVRGIRFKRADDGVIGMAICSPESREKETLLTVSESGYGKRTQFEEYRLQGRGDPAS